MDREEDYPFCRDSGYLQGEECVARFDKYPVTPGHTLIVPKRHIPTWFEMSSSEQLDAMRLLRIVKDHLDMEYGPDGYYIGMNCGAHAGQTVEHAHIHVIPRYEVDLAKPQGGVRGVIPDKMDYPQEN